MLWTLSLTSCISHFPALFCDTLVMCQFSFTGIRYCICTQLLFLTLCYYETSTSTFPSRVCTTCNVHIMYVHSLPLRIFKECIYLICSLYHMLSMLQTTVIAVYHLYFCSNSESHTCSNALVSFKLKLLNLYLEIKTEYICEGRLI